MDLPIVASSGPGSGLGRQAPDTAVAGTNEEFTDAIQ